MATFAPRGKDVLASLAAEILHNYPHGRVIVAIDGQDGAGKTHFAEELAATLRHGGHSSFHASIDDFHRSRAERHARGADSADGYYRDSFNYILFRRILVDPFKAGRFTSFVLKGFDHNRDADVEPKWLTAPDDAILVIDGIFLNRPELRGLWNYSVWLDVDSDVANSRMLDRDGPSIHPERYEGGRAIYLKEAKPREVATAIVDNNDFEHPRRVFADAC
jgi:uridine kinase